MSGKILFECIVSKMSIGCIKKCGARVQKASIQINQNDITFDIHGMLLIITNRIRSLAIYIIDIFCIQTTIFILTVLIERMHKLFRLNCKKWLKKLVVTRPYIAEIEKCKSY